MPVEQMERISHAHLTPEVGKVKIGDRGGTNSAPRKSDAVITSALKPKGGSAFAVDKQAMDAIAAYMTKNATSMKKNAIPVTLVSDDPMQNFHIYRGIFNKMHTSMCLSVAGSPTAQRRYREEKYKNGLNILDTPIEVKCDSECPEWLENGEKGVCGWHANLSLMINIPGYQRFPSRFVFRTSGWQVIQHLIGSLNAIRQETGGTLANIPLWLVMTEVEGFNKAEKKRRSYPVMSFEFWGSLTELRERAINENQLRLRLEQSKDPSKTKLDTESKHSFGALSSTDMQMGNEAGGAIVDMDELAAMVSQGESSPDDAGDVMFFDDDEPVDETKDAPEQVEINKLVESLAITPTSYKAIVDDADGVVSVVLSRLRLMGGTPKAVDVPLVVKDAVEKEPEIVTEAPKAEPVATPAVSTPVPSAQPEDDEYNFMTGEVSSEPSETESTAQREQREAAEAAAAAKIKADEVAAEAKAKATESAETKAMEAAASSSSDGLDFFFPD